MAEACKERCCHACRQKGCWTNCSKAILATVNFAFLICGWSILGLGVWLRINRDSLVLAHLLTDPRRTPDNPTVSPAPETAVVADQQGTETMSTTFDSVAFCLIGVGGFLAAMSFLGCCGACAESVCFLGFYTLLTSMVVAGEIVCASFSSTFISQISAKLLTNMHQQLHTEYNYTAKKTTNTMSESYKMTLAWDTLQIQLQCCGAQGPRDYFYSSWFNHTQDSTGYFVPPSCCLLLNDDPRKPVAVDENLCQLEAILLGRTNQPITQVHVQGCYRTILELFNSYQNFALTSLLVTVLSQVMSFACSCFLIARIRKKQSDYSCYDNDDYE